MSILRRRALLAGTTALLAAPAVVRADALGEWPKALARTTAGADSSEVVTANRARRRRMLNMGIPNKIVEKIHITS